MATKRRPEKPKAPDWGISTVFPTQVLARDWGDGELNKQLREAIWRDRALDPVGLYRSNQSGTWHSKDRIMERIGDPGRKLWKMFGEGFMTYATAAFKLDQSKYDCDIRMSAWAMVYADRGYAAVHTHPNCHVSGVYYVSNDIPEKEQVMATGVPLKAGDIEFLDTRRGGEYQVEGLRMNPSAIFSYASGRMLIFPSSLPHYVHPVQGEGERIAVACNATYKLKDKE